MASTGGQAAPPAEGNPQPAVTFITSPWDLDIDLSTKPGKMLWDEGISPLENKFTGYGKDLARFLAAVKNRADKCKWMDILTFGTRTLIKQYGEISTVEVETARATRAQVTATTLAEARPQINSLMMFHFLYESLGSLPQKKLSTKLDDMKQDGPTLLKTILDQTFVATQAATFTIKEKLYDLQLKHYKWNVQMLNQDVREKMADLEAAGHASDKTDVIIALFRAYGTSTNEEFKNAVSYWKNEWNSGAVSKVEELMDRADAKYSELRELGTWGKRAAKDDQIIALTGQIEQLKKAAGQGNAQPKSNTSSTQNRTPKWKYDRSQSSTEALTKNGKTYKWCEGPGHNKVAMWVLHEPGKCDSEYRRQPQNQTPKPTPEPKFDRSSLTATLKAKGFSDDEVESKLEAIFAVLDS